jgi:hypothetical protein
LLHANFSSSTISVVDFQDAYLIGADFSNAEVMPGIHLLLINAAYLAHAKMPDGSIYDGRYSCEKEVNMINILKSAYNGDEPNDHDFAEYYGVTVNQYLIGQEWAKKNYNTYEILNKKLIEEYVSNIPSLL